MGEKDTENERRVVLDFARLSPNKIAECSVTQRWFLSREMLLLRSSKNKPIMVGNVSIPSGVWAMFCPCQHLPSASWP